MSNSVSAWPRSIGHAKEFKFRMSTIVSALISGAFMTALPVQAAISPTDGQGTFHEWHRTHEAQIIKVAQVEQQYSINIPAQPLPTALKALYKQTGMNFAYSTNVLKDVEANGVKGNMSASKALHALVSGTKAKAKVIGEDTATIQVAQEDAVQLDGIVVYGEKTERDWVDTYSSVGIVTGEDIGTYNIDDLGESFNHLANVRWFNGSGNNGFTIRGINSEGVTQPSNNAPVTSVIIDGAVQSVESTRRGARGTWDIKQVEVFRGPQSTLQGRAAIAGAVIIETNDPTYTTEMGFKGIMAGDDRKDAGFYISAPIFDKPGVTTVDGADFFKRELNDTALNRFTEFREADNDNYIADIKYKIGDNITLRSISSKVNSETNIYSPPASAYIRDDQRKGDDFTQDLRLTFGTTKDKFSGVVGAFYGDFNQPVNSSINYDTGFGILELQDLDSNNQTTTKSIYADVRYRVLNDWSILAGARYISEDVRNVYKGLGFNGNNFFAPIAVDVDNTKTFNVFLPKIGLAYDITEDHKLAFIAQKGYRNGFTEVSDGLVNEVEAEFLWSYEVSYRAQSASKNWSFGATAFYYNYTNQQIPVTDLNSPVVITLNSGESHSYGAEFEGRYNFDNGLSIFGSLGILKTEFDSLVTNKGDFTGNEFPEAPQVTAPYQMMRS